MDFVPALARRFAALNPGKHAQVMPVHVSPDGHGTYMIEGDGKKHFVQQVYVNPAEAKALSHGKTNQNLDSHLRI